MEDIKVNLTHDEVSAYFRDTMKVSTPDKCWNFAVSFSTGQIDEIQEECEAKLDTREFKNVKACHSFIESKIYAKMKVLPSRIVNFDPASLSMTPKVIIAFRKEISRLTGIDKYKPAQQLLPGVNK